jgi:sRNA-binding regulator protein Hfq
VKVVVFNGADIEGDLVGFDTETLVVDCVSGVSGTVLVYKSAVQYVEEPTSRGGFNA